MELERGQWWHPQATNTKGHTREPRQIVWVGARTNAPKAMRHLFHGDESSVGYRCKATPTFQNTGHDSWMSESGFKAWIRRTQATLGPDPFVPTTLQPCTLYESYKAAIEALEQIKQTGTRQESQRIGDAYSEAGWNDYTVQSDEAKIAEDALGAIGLLIQLNEHQADKLETAFQKIKSTG